MLTATLKLKLIDLKLNHVFKRHVGCTFVRISKYQAEKSVHGHFVQRLSHVLGSSPGTLIPR